MHHLLQWITHLSSKATVHRMLFTCMLLSMAQSLFAQVEYNSDVISKIVYHQSYHGQFDENQNPIWLYADNNYALITSKNQWNKTAPYPSEMTLVNHQSESYTLFALLNDYKIIATNDSTSIALQTFEYLDETKEILGYACKKAKTSINSNTIELWYTQDLNIKGSPTILGQNLGLVLEYVRNGNFVIQAVALEKKTIQLPDFMIKNEVTILDKVTYQDEVWRSRFTTIPLFDRQQIHFSDNYEPREDVMRFAHGTIVLKKIQFPEINSQHQVFLDLTEQSNGDAYDRTGTVFLIPTDKKTSFLDGLQEGTQALPIYVNGNGKQYHGVVATDDYHPAVELMRFFTPFGVKHFNHRVTLKGKTWQDSAFYRQDITPFASLLSNREVYIGVFIGNYDQGGHMISAHITIHNEASTNNEPLRQVKPLFNTLNIMEMAGQEYGTMFDHDKGLTIDFTLGYPMKNAQLIYTTTGHGGWGQGDEFVPKKNTILLNGKTVFDLTPWRSDCGSYRLFNPVSGNFSNGLSSSDYSRSNWCPGTVTNPYIIDLGDLRAGKHQLQVVIPQGAPEGSSFSAWNVSGVIVGDVNNE